MCVFCGGTCGGVGDAILPYATLGIMMAAIKIKAWRSSRKKDTEEKEPEETEPDYPEE